MILWWKYLEKSGAPCRIPKSRSLVFQALRTVKPFNTAVVRISSREDFDRVLSEYLEWRKGLHRRFGRTPPRYQLPPMVASFMQEEEHQAKQKKKAIAVPKGPVEVW